MSVSQSQDLLSEIHSIGGQDRKVIGQLHLHFIHHLLILLVKSHLQLYPCPLQINYLWNLGFLLGISIIIQIITGIFLGLHYTSDLNSAYYSIFFFIREIYYGWYLRYFHSNGATCLLEDMSVSQSQDLLSEIHYKRIYGQEYMV